MHFAASAYVCVRALGNTVALCPPLIITREQVDEMIDGLHKGLDAALSIVSKEG